MKHLIEVWLGDWVEQLSKMNEAVGERNRLHKFTNNIRLVKIISKMEFWKCFGCIILAVIYGKKGCMIWEERHIYDAGKAPSPIDRDVSEKKDLLKVRYCLYHYHYCYLIQ